MCILVINVLLTRSFRCHLLLRDLALASAFVKGERNFDGAKGGLRIAALQVGQHGGLGRYGKKALFRLASSTSMEVGADRTPSSSSEFALVWIVFAGATICFGYIYH